MNVRALLRSFREHLAAAWSEAQTITISAGPITVTITPERTVKPEPSALQRRAKGGSPSARCPK